MSSSCSPAASGECRADPPGAGTRELLRFFAPLAAASMMMMLTHSVVNGALARTSRPDVALAAYALALSLAVIVEAPVLAVRQMTMALASTADRFRIVQRVAVLTAAGSLAAAAVIAYTPLGRLAIVGLLGAPPHLVDEVLLAFRVLALLVITCTVRGLYQGLLIRNRATLVITLGMAGRVAAMSALAWALTTHRWLDGAVLGAAIFIAGMLVEGLVSAAAVHLRQSRGEGWDRPAGEGHRRIVRFYLPLVLAGVAASLGKPVINAGLARTPEAAAELAAFAVAAALAWILIAPCQNIHQAVMVYYPDPAGRPALKRFAAVFALLTCTVLLALTWSGAGRWLLVQVLGLPLPLVPPTLRALRVLAFLPLGLTAADYYSGVLLQEGQTRMVGAARAANVVALIIVTTLLVILRPTLGASIGPLAQVAGSIAEATLLAGMAGTPTGTLIRGAARRLTAPVSRQLGRSLPG
ncbi:MAG: hypothetical protein RDU89_10155 [bacterium]|nr:hypothetical protein [bacterium]